MSETEEVDRLLTSGARSAKFPTIGTVVRGEILAVKAEQQRDFDTGEPLYWVNKKPSIAGDPATDRPVMMVVATLQTTDDEGADDDGIRNVYIKFMMEKAVREALQKTGAKLRTGGVLGIKYVGDGDAEGRKQPPKLYKAEYQAPAFTGVDPDSII